MQTLPQHPASVLWQPPPAIEEVFTSLPVAAHPEPEQQPAVQQTRKLKLHSARRPAHTNGHNGNGQHQPQLEEKETLR